MRTLEQGQSLSEELGSARERHSWLPELKWKEVRAFDQQERCKREQQERHRKK
jgi:hypothetical protein